MSHRYNHKEAVKNSKIAFNQQKVDSSNYRNAHASSGKRGSTNTDNTDKTDWRTEGFKSVAQYNRFRHLLAQKEAEASAKELSRIL